MRSWQRTKTRTVCGLCAVSIPVGAPVQVISQIGLTRVLRRCPACADGTFDVGQLTVPPSQQLSVPMAWRNPDGSIPDPFASVSKLAADFKIRQIGEEG